MMVFQLKLLNNSKLIKPDSTRTTDNMKNSTELKSSSKIFNKSKNTMNTEEKQLWDLHFSVTWLTKNSKIPILQDSSLKLVPQSKQQLKDFKSLIHSIGLVRRPPQLRIKVNAVHVGLSQLLVLLKVYIGVMDQVLLFLNNNLLIVLVSFMVTLVVMVVCPLVLWTMLQRMV